MNNMFKMLKDAVSTQKSIKKIQHELEQKTVEYAGSDGMVRATARGDASLTGIKINPSALDPNQAKKLEAKILEAVNGALENAKKLSAEHMQKVMGDMGLPNIPGV